MSRSGISLTLVLALAWVTLAQGQTSSPAAGSPESRVGKVITVSEVNRAPEKCMVLQVWRMPDGNPAMQAKSVESGEMMSIVEAPKSANPAERFRVFRWGAQGVPPAGCPVPPGAKLPVYTEAPKTVIASGVQQASAKVPANTKTEGVVQAYLPPAEGTKVVNAGAPVQAGPVKETRTSTGPVIVGQPNVPVQLLNRPVEAAPVVQASAQAPAPLPMPAGEKAPAPMVLPAPTPAPVQGAPAPAAPVASSDCSCEPGRTILVTEQGCAPQQCQVLSVTGHGLSKTMQVKNLCTGECFTLVEGGHHKFGGILSKFYLFRGKQACPVTCSNCDACAGGTAVSQGAPVTTVVSGPMPASPIAAALPMPKDITPPTNVQSTMATTNGSKYASGLLPPGEAPVLTGKQVIATSTPPSLAQTTLNAAPTKPAGESTWKKIWSRPDEVPQDAKTEAAKTEIAKDEDKIEKAKELMRPTEKKTETVVKTEVVGVSVPQAVEGQSPSMKPAELPVPVPLIPLATTDPRPTAPPPQPPINPYSTMGSVAMAKYAPQDTLPPMCPACRRPLPTGTNGAAGAMPTGVQQASACSSCQSGACQPGLAMSPGPVSASGWTRGPSMPVSQSPVMVPARRLMSETDAQAMQNTVHLMTVLQSSGVPAQREWAAGRLRVCDAQMHPYVVESLVTAARTDGAPMVRAAAIASLAQMKANTPPVMVTLENARQDRDPRVRDEAIQAVRLLTGTDTTSVQPAAYKVERK